MLLAFVIYVYENSFEVAISHGVVQLVKHDTQIYQLIRPTDERIFKSDMYISQYDSKILTDNLCESFHVAIFLFDFVLSSIPTLLFLNS